MAPFSEQRAFREVILRQSAATDLSRDLHLWEQHLLLKERQKCKLKENLQTLTQPLHFSRETGRLSRATQLRSNRQASGLRYRECTEVGVLGPPNCDLRTHSRIGGRTVQSGTTTRDIESGVGG